MNPQLLGRCILDSVNPENEQFSPRQRTLAESQILSLAKQFLGGQLGVIAASRELSPLRHEVEADLAEVLLVFMTSPSFCTTANERVYITCTLSD